MVRVLGIVHNQNHIAMCPSKYNEVIDVCRICNKKVIFYYLRFVTPMELSNDRGSGDLFTARTTLPCARANTNEAGVTFDNSFFNNYFDLVRQLKNRSFLGTVFVHVTGQTKN